MNRRRTLALALALLPVPAGADTLAEAVRAAAATNPVLAAARARQDALAEAPEQARVLRRLTADGGGVAGYDRFGGGRAGIASVSANLPIWTGGRAASAVRAAQGDVAAGEQALREAEAQVLTDVVGAYAGLMLQQQAVEIADAQIALLDAQVAEAEARFRLGTGTQTDVMQLRAQREAALGNQAGARAALAAGAADYRAVVGRDPGRLAPPPDALPGVPATLADARARAEAANPLVNRADAAQLAAAARVGAARAEGAPELGLGGGYGYGYALGGGGAGPGGLRNGGFNSAASVGLTFRLPILTGGLVASRVRAARADLRAAGLDRDAAAREAVRAVEGAWAAAAAARDRTGAATRAVAAAQRALEGVKAEYSLGLRSTLDILIADQSLRSAQLSLATARSDLLTSGAALLRATGTLTAARFAEGQLPDSAP